MASRPRAARKLLIGRVAARRDVSVTSLPITYHDASSAQRMQRCSPPPILRTSSIRVLNTSYDSSHPQPQSCLLPSFHPVFAATRDITRRSSTGYALAPCLDNRDTIPTHHYIVHRYR